MLHLLEFDYYYSIAMEILIFASSLHRTKETSQYVKSIYIPNQNHQGSRSTHVCWSVRLSVKTEQFERYTEVLGLYWHT